MINKLDLDIFIETGRIMIRDGIVIAPWLTWGKGEHRISFTLFTDIRTWSRHFAAQHWRPDWTMDIFGGQPIHVERAAEACREAVSSTAVYLCHLELGTLTVTEEMVSVAQRLTENFVEKVGLKDFVTFYLLTNMYEDLQVLHYYGSIHVNDFLQGDIHRPWGTNTLTSEFKQAVASRLVTVRDGFVELTHYGNEVLQSITRVFVESGFLKFRSRLVRLNNFNNLEDVESLTNILIPSSASIRKSLLELSEIQAGSHVLELGCGTGAYTFDAGLFQAVGPNGYLVVTDPSTGMLSTVRRKRDDYHAEWVHVVRAQAERLPFPDNMFDSVTGCGFLHLTNIHEALREIARVLKPGGTFSTFYPLHFPVRSDFFLEWFEPLLSLESKASHPDVLPDSDTVPAAMKSLFEIIRLDEFEHEIHYTSPQTVVEFFVEVTNLFEEKTAILPWRARQDLIQRLIQRGEEICRKYQPESLVERHPAQMIRAVVKSK
ncbi:methyltransferase domain-containing protein [Alicyclobacillus macrosporangiidus]|uniref:Methyltransferase domain-containing protein n=1 Tax=Alicyclobacillus macrosporangiidus TaxID=392015 RepID=A0A1I7IZ05_9BACL|nr:methyltransferase domain-containing protein [Alicyclobacillus macrosporangiidus]SFU78102.1 Methyltransferase domain-containing protein [Alicyclobacillus macrosporangiidus]